jgi:hypothetical protein
MSLTYEQLQERCLTAENKLESERRIISSHKAELEEQDVIIRNLRLEVQQLKEQLGIKY